MITIPAGEVKIPFDVAVINDSVLEGNEHFNLIIVRGSLPNGVTSDNPITTRVIIVDDDSKSLCLFV